MPFAILEDQEKKNQEQGANISGSSNTFNVNVPGQNAGAGSQGNKSQSESGQYQNIQKYLNANQEQGTDIGQKVAQGVESKIGSAKTQGQNLQSSVSGPQAYDPNQVLSNLPNATEEQKQQYKTMKQTGGYTGPSSVSDIGNYSQFQKEKESAKTALDQTKTDVGQQDLLTQTFNRPNYTKGAKVFDQTLLAQSQGGKQAIENLGQKYSNLMGELGGYEQGAQANIAQAQAQAAQNKSAFAPVEQKARENIINPIQQRVSQAQAQEQGFQNYLSDISDLNLTPETMEALGLTQGQRIYNTNLSNYYVPSTAPASVQTLANSQERQNYNMLMDFLGQNSGDLSLGEPTYQASKFDKERLAQDIAQKNAEFEAAAKAKQIQSGRYQAGQENWGEDWGVPMYSSANASAWDLMNNGTPAYDTGFVDNMRIAGSQTEAWKQQAQQQAYQDLMNQLNEFYNQYGYNNVIGGA